MIILFKQLWRFKNNFINNELEGEEIVNSVKYICNYIINSIFINFLKCLFRCIVNYYSW